MKTSVYLPNELATQAKALGLSISELAQAAVRSEVESRTQFEELKESGMERIVVIDGPVKKAFVGKWLVTDDIHGEWGLALTHGGRFVLHIDEANPELPQRMFIYENFKEMEDRGVSGEILTAANAALGHGEYVVELDI